MDDKKEELASFLKEVPPVDFCCVFGSSLHPNNRDEGSMVDYILGVSDPLKWRSEVREIADDIGVGVHFNPFFSWNDKMLKYGVIRINDLINDILNRKRFYLSGRLQKHVNVLLDNLDIENVDSAAVLLLQHGKNFTAKSASSHTGDVRILFAEDVNKVKKIVQGQFSLFQSMYRLFLEEYETKSILRFSSCNGHRRKLSQAFDRVKQIGLK